MELNDVRPLTVSIRCLVYNHEPYLRDCLEGFVMQKTNFRYEAIVHDDCSTDRSAEIIREYAEKYPDIIKPIYETENQWKKGTLDKIMDAACQGKYIAYCEGDDYWINPNKLQKQVDFLETHPEYSACFGNFLTHTMSNGVKTKMLHRKSYYDLHDVMSGKMFGLQNICIRRNYLDVPIITNVNGDMKVYYQCAILGKIGYINQDFAVYRLTGSGVATGRAPEEQFEIKLKHYYIFHKDTGFKDNRALVKSQVYDLLQEVLVNRTKIRAKFALLNKYKAPISMRYLWILLYICEFGLVSVFNKLKYPKGIISKI